jgi:hypothetical protein
VGTDGKQLLLHKGLRCPWSGDLLIPRSTAFGLAELQRQEQVEIGQTETHVCLQAGPWEIFLPIDKEGRFPRADDVVPKITQGSTCCRLSSQDAAFLLRSLPGLPTDEENEAVTLDLNGTVAVRARTPGQEQGTELILAGSESTGKLVRLCMSRRYLTRALEMGFSQFDIVSPDVPVQCRDESRTYLWMPLDKSGALASSEKDLRVHSSTAVTSAPLVNNHPETPNKRIKVMTQAARLSSPPPSPSPNGNKDHLDRNSTSLIEQVQTLQGTLREALNQTTRLVQGLRHQRKQSRLMKATLASLRQLQQVAE